MSGVLTAVVRQPDGKFVVGGVFTEINGVPANNLARLLPDGTVDAAFTAASAANGPVMALALQTDGKIVVGGSFSSLSGGARVAIGRLLPTGTLDTPFAPPSVALNGATPTVYSLAVQPDGRVLLGGYFNVRGTNTTQLLDRLDGASGQPDANFRPYQAANTGVYSLLLLPNGKIVVGGSAFSYQLGTLLTQLHPDGSPDNSFTSLTNYYTSEIRALTLDEVGNIYAAGLYNSAGSGHPYLRRLRPNGTTDASFDYRGNQLNTIRALSIQPNGRLLTGGLLTERVVTTGAVDGNFLSKDAPRAASNPNNNWGVSALLVQPDGAIMVAGSLQHPSLAYTTALVRLREANVLHVSSSVADARTNAWPVPSRQVLHVNLDASSSPQRVQLLDALGRPVRTIMQPNPAFTLSLTGLVAGIYHLQVQYAEAKLVTRRVVIVD
ncbi:T9SS type A sorting domain-containing protein [Hymenobacter sp. 5516J-16]|uniref:T9SS type A sorting domain-containing protein n=1 Tax=Hymenobacter sp. 5516J-16 TaxID=2932253 RepID=UPI001FD2315F|nr:T9SS type A sorting domain-containing protein [Hymenobacter sp. 5516J-16]UOQ76743.1 T9SS type A sorting domain-containing protein [Hymenobacter sp. 5516J-16]